MSKTKNSARHDFLLTLFPDHNISYAVLKMNGFVLIRYVAPEKGRCFVAIYTQESFEKVEAWKSAQQPIL